MESTFSSGESTTGRIGVQHTGKRGPGTSSYTFVKPRVQCVPAATQQPARDRYGQKLPYSALPSLGNDPALMYSVHIVGQQRQMAVCLTQLARLEPDEGPQSPRQRRMACGCKRNDGDQRLKHFAKPTLSTTIYGRQQRGLCRNFLSPAHQWWPTN